MAAEKILVVDDEEAIREVVTTLLEARGYQCTAVGNGRAALEHLEKNSLDLVLSDMVMPEMDGLRLLEWVRAREEDLPVIMVTAMHDLSTALEAIRRGAYDYVLKPFEKDQLFLSVRRALEHRDRGAALQRRDRGRHAADAATCDDDIRCAARHDSPRLRKFCESRIGGSCWTRTNDQGIMSPLL